MNTSAYLKVVGDNFDLLTNLVLADPSTPYEFQEGIIQQLKTEGGNLLYHAVNTATGVSYTNAARGDTLVMRGGAPQVSAGYSNVWYYDGSKLKVFRDGQAVDYQKTGGDLQTIASRLMIHSPDQQGGNLSSLRIILAVKDDITQNYYGQSTLYSEMVFHTILGPCLGILILLFLISLGYFLYRRKEKRLFDEALAEWFSRLWLEVKLILAIPGVTLLIVPLAIMSSTWGSTSFGSDFIIRAACAGLSLAGGILWLYLVVIDLSRNRGRIVSRNFVNFLLQEYRSLEAKYPWQEKMLKRTYALIAAETVLALSAVFFLVVSIQGGGPVIFFLALILTSVGVYLIYRYMRQFRQTINSLGLVVNQIEMIKNGTSDAPLALPEEDDMRPCADNLNLIQEGVDRAIAEKLKADRFKMELVTNVSHDLKTPLTSIISYVELLDKEENLPEHVRDYVKILALKSERLKTLIQDLFDLSRASSENIRLDLERIDLVRLIQQVTADMEEQIIDSGLTIRTSFPEGPMYIDSDGDKLKRVWENLITNALKYSLPGSRIFIDITRQKSEVVTTIKNTANYEMNFTADEVLQRFVRGDEARSTEGSGLGLSIAQTFTQICGGHFSVTIDGDLFKVELRFRATE